MDQPVTPSELQLLQAAFCGDTAIMARLLDSGTDPDCWECVSYSGCAAQLFFFLS
eukprot:m.35858 g.35858  ORF g.35858 m.35858 type:complete len:55 (+) comp5743_c0_seq2:138-302(+)